MISRYLKTGISICLVDENPTTRKKLGEILNSLGIHIPIFCSNLQMAIEEYKNYTVIGPPHFILTEWTREFYDPAFIAYFQNSPLAEIPIILLYGDSQTEAISEIKEVRIVQFLKKPISRSELKATIQKYLRSKTDERSN